MVVTNDFINILLPVLSHWIMWVIFLIIGIGILSLYAYPYIRKNKKEFRKNHISVIITGIVSLYIFTKMLESVIYQESILKVDFWLNKIVYSSGITKLASVITAFGSTTAITSLFIIALIVLLLRKRWRYALLSTVAILGALFLQLAIKSLVHRVRPENLIETTFSFPSGHSIMGIVFVSLLIYSFRDDFKIRTVKYVLIILSFSFFITVGISRIILHVHWFSDVLAGISLGLFWFMTIILIERSIPGVIPAIKTETKKAELVPIVQKVLKN